MAKIAHKPWMETLNTAGIGITADVAVTAGVWAQIGIVTMGAGQALNLGYGGLAGQDSAIGRIYGTLKTSADAECNGILRFELRDPEGHTIQTVWEGRTESLRTSATDRSIMLPFPDKKDHRIFQNNSLAVMYKGDASVTVGNDESKFLVDGTKWSVIEQ